MIHLVMLGIVCRTCDPDNMVSAEIRSTTERHMVLMLRTFACGYYEPTTSTTNPFRRRPPPPRMGTHWSA